ncbi:putative GDNF/GAS1 domain-containing protein 1, partial [Homarus americanus]
MHPLKHIPTCGEAAEICRDNPWCKQRLDMFRSTCKFRDGHCRNPDREDCMKSWLQLRETPLLGCICPDDHDKKCSRLYSLVNENPCVGESYPGRVALMSRVSAALSTQLTRPVPVPTGAATLLIISSSHADPLYPLSTIHHYLQHLPASSTCLHSSASPVSPTLPHLPTPDSSTLHICHHHHTCVMNFTPASST